MQWHIWLAAATVIGVGGIMQSAVGFGYALLATPLLIWLGIPLPRTIVIVATCSLFQSALGARQLRANVPWRAAGTAIAVRTVAVLVGILWLKKLAILNPDDVRGIVGGIICALVAVQILFRVQPVERVRVGWGGLAFVGSGLLAGLCGMGGPPLVLWAMAHRWPNERIRGFLFAVFTVSIPIQLLFLYLTFGTDVLRSVGIAVLMAPAVLLGSWAGMPIGNRMPRRVLRTVAYGVLVAVGLSALLPWVAHVLRPAG